MQLMPKKETLYGTAAFAKEGDLVKNKLFGDSDGIIIGEFNKKHIKFGGQQFVALGAPTRSGKGVGIVIPNLLTYRNSAVVQDLKQECFDFTSKYRAEKLGHEIFLFNPFDSRTHRYNPLGYIEFYIKKEDGGLIANPTVDGQLIDFANILYPLEGGGENTAFFNGLAQSLFMGLCYMYRDLWYNTEARSFLTRKGIKLDFTMPGILALSEGLSFEVGGDKLSSKDVTEFELFKNEYAIMNPDKEEIQGESRKIENFEDTYAFFKGTGWLSHKCIERIGTYFKIDSDNTRSGVMSSFNAPLLIYKAETLQMALSGAGEDKPFGDFDFRDLRKKKMTIYVGITADQLVNARPILNMFWQQLILLNTKELPQTHPELKYPVMLMMDEFTASGYLATYQKGISFIAGYGLRSVMIYQSQSQLEERTPLGYGREGASVLLTNHACQIYYTPREDADADKLSKALGNKTVKSRSKNWGGEQKHGPTGSESEHSRALMLPQEVKAMPDTDEIILIEKVPPIRGQKAFYYNRSYFYSRFIEISPSLQKKFGLSYTDVIDNPAFFLGDTHMKFLDDAYLKREGLFDIFAEKAELSEKELEIYNKTKDKGGFIRRYFEKRMGKQKHPYFKTLKAMQKGKIVCYERYFAVNKPLNQGDMNKAIGDGETAVQIPRQLKEVQKLLECKNDLVEVEKVCIELARQLKEKKLNSRSYSEDENDVDDIVKEYLED